MLPRLLASALAACLALTGVLPAVGGVRCLAMGRRVATTHGCCPRNKAPAPREELKAPCCETVQAPSVEARAPGPGDTAQPSLAPAPLVGVIALAAAPSAPAVVLRLAALPRGQPPGQRLSRLSAVLRI